MSSEAEHYRLAWIDRRRRYLIFRAVQVATIPWVLGVLFAVAHLPPVKCLTGPVALAAFIFAFFFVGLGPYVLIGFWLNRFRCPRCSQFYYWSFSLKDGLNRFRGELNWRDCHHCGLHQDAMP